MHPRCVESDAPPFWQLVAGLAGAIVLLYLFRRSDKKAARHDQAKLAAVIARDAEPFSLSAPAPAEGGCLAYLRYVVKYPGHEDDFRLMCRIAARLDGEAQFDKTLAISIRRPSASSAAEHVTTEYRVSFKTYGPGYKRESRVLLGEFAPAAGGTIDLEGQVDALAPTEIMELEIYLVPAAHRL